MMRAVLDTNVVMSAIFFGGLPFDVLTAWHNGRFELVVSEAVMGEYREIAARMKTKFPTIAPERWLSYIESHATMVFAALFAPTTKIVMITRTAKMGAAFIPAKPVKKRK